MGRRPISIAGEYPRVIQDTGFFVDTNSGPLDCMRFIPYKGAPARAVRYIVNRTGYKRTEPSIWSEAMLDAALADTRPNTFHVFSEVHDIEIRRQAAEAVRFWPRFEDL